MNNKGMMRNFGSGFISDVILKIRLTISLLKDNRVNTLYKLIPVLCLVYLIVPLDFLFGPIDDAVVLYLGMDLFISLCPPELVQEYTEKINGSGANRESGQVVDAEFKKE